MTTKKTIALFITSCLLLAGCANFQDDSGNSALNDNKSSDIINQEDFASKPEDETQTISPLPDTTMENLTDAILSVSLEEGDAYVDDKGIMQMDLKIYTYDKYDMSDVANLKVGDTILTESGAVEVSSKEQSEMGTIHINGGLEAGGIDLIEYAAVICHKVKSLIFQAAVDENPSVFTLFFRYHLDFTGVSDQSISDF